MAKAYLLDSDICLDAITGRKPFSSDAVNILYLAEIKKFNAVLTPLSFSNMFYLLSKWSSREKAYVQLVKLRSMVTVAHVSQQEIDKALYAKRKYFEDAIQYFSALSNGCDAIITRNENDYSNSNIPILSPEKFLLDIK